MHYSYLAWSCDCTNRGELRAENGILCCETCSKEVRQYVTSIEKGSLKEVSMEQYPMLNHLSPEAAKELQAFAADVAAYAVGKHIAFVRSRFQLPLKTHQEIRMLLDELEAS